MRRRYYERSLPELGRIVLEARGLRPRVSRFAYCAEDGRVFVSDDLVLLERLVACGSDAAAVYLLETRARNTGDVVLSTATVGVGATPGAAPSAAF